MANLFCCPECGNHELQSIKTTMETVWFCSKCGNKFKHPADMRTEIANKKKIIKTLLTKAQFIGMILMFLITLIISCTPAKYAFPSNFSTWLWFADAILVICVIVNISRSSKLTKEINRIEQELRILEIKMNRFKDTDKDNGKEDKETEK